MGERHLEKKTQSFRRHASPEKEKTRKRSSSTKRSDKSRSKSRSKSRGRTDDISYGEEKRQSRRRSNSRSKGRHSSVKKRTSQKESWSDFVKSDSLHSFDTETSPTGSLTSESGGDSHNDAMIEEVESNRGRARYSNRKKRSQSCPRMQHDKQVRFSLNGAIATPNKPSEKMDETTAIRMANLVSELIGETHTPDRLVESPNISHLSFLSVKELKHKLDQKGIDYSDCLEKQDLVSKLTSADKERDVYNSATKEEQKPADEKRRSKSSSKSKKSSKKEKSSKRGVSRQRSSSLPPMRRERDNEDNSDNRASSSKRSGRRSRRDTESSRGRGPTRGLERQRSSSLPPNAGMATSGIRRGRRSRDRDHSPQRGVERQRSSSLPPHDSNAESSRRRRDSRREESLPRRGIERKRSSSLPPNGADGRGTRRGSRRSSFAQSKGKAIHPTLGGSQHKSKQRTVRDEHDWMLFDKSGENDFNCDNGRSKKTPDCVSNGVKDALASHWNDVLDFGAVQGHVAVPDEQEKKSAASKATNKSKRRNRPFSLGLFSSKKYGSV